MSKPLIANPSPHTEYMRRWRSINKQRNKQYQAEYYKKYSADPDKAKAARERARKWYEANREKAKANGRARYAKDPEKTLEANRKYLTRNIDRMREYHRRYNAKRRAAKMAVTIGDINYELVLEAANGTCQLCGDNLSDKWHFDHIIPLARGGEHRQENLQVTHPRCNQRKNARLEWAHLFYK